MSDTQQQAVAASDITNNNNNNNNSNSDSAILSKPGPGGLLTVPPRPQRPAGPDSKKSIVSNLSTVSRGDGNQKRHYTSNQAFSQLTNSTNRNPDGTENWKAKIINEKGVALSKLVKKTGPVGKALIEEKNKNSNDIDKSTSNTQGPITVLETDIRLSWPFNSAVGTGLKGGGSPHVNGYKTSTINNDIDPQTTRLFANRRVKGSTLSRPDAYKRGNNANSPFDSNIQGPIFTSAISQKFSTNPKYNKFRGNPLSKRNKLCSEMWGGPISPGIAVNTDELASDDPYILERGDLACGNQNELVTGSTFVMPHNENDINIGLEEGEDKYAGLSSRRFNYYRSKNQNPGFNHPDDKRSLINTSNQLQATASITTHMARYNDFNNNNESLSSTAKALNTSTSPVDYTYLTPVTSGWPSGDYQAKYLVYQQQKEAQDGVKHAGTSTGMLNRDQMELLRMTDFNRPRGVGTMNPRFALGEGSLSDGAMGVKEERRDNKHFIMGDSGMKGYHDGGEKGEGFGNNNMMSPSEYLENMPGNETPTELQTSNRSLDDFTNRSNVMDGSRYESDPFNQHHSELDILKKRDDESNAIQKLIQKKQWKRKNGLNLLAQDRQDDLYHRRQRMALNLAIERERLGMRLPPQDDIQELKEKEKEGATGHSLSHKDVNHWDQIRKDLDNEQGTAHIRSNSCSAVLSSDRYRDIANQIINTPGEDLAHLSSKVLQAVKKKGLNNRKFLKINKPWANLPAAGLSHAFREIEDDPESVLKGHPPRYEWAAEENGNAKWQFKMHKDLDDSRNFGNYDGGNLTPPGSKHTIEPNTVMRINPQGGVEPKELISTVNNSGKSFGETPKLKGFNRFIYGLIDVDNLEGDNTCEKMDNKMRYGNRHSSLVTSDLAKQTLKPQEYPFDQYPYDYTVKKKFKSDAEVALLHKGLLKHNLEVDEFAAFDQEELRRSKVGRATTPATAAVKYHLFEDPRKQHQETDNERAERRKNDQRSIEEMIRCGKYDTKEHNSNGISGYVMDCNNPKNLVGYLDPNMEGSKYPYGHAHDINREIQDRIRQKRRDIIATAEPLSPEEDLFVRRELIRHGGKSPKGFLEGSLVADLPGGSGEFKRSKYWNKGSKEQFASQYYCGKDLTDRYLDNDPQSVGVRERHVRMPVGVSCRPEWFNGPEFEGRVFDEQLGMSSDEWRDKGLEEGRDIENMKMKGINLGGPNGVSGNSNPSNQNQKSKHSTRKKDKTQRGGGKNEFSFYEAESRGSGTSGSSSANGDNNVYSEDCVSTANYSNVTSSKNFQNNKFNLNLNQIQNRNLPRDSESIDDDVRSNISSRSIRSSRSVASTSRMSRASRRSHGLRSESMMTRSSRNLKSESRLTPSDAITMSANSESQSLCGFDSLQGYASASSVSGSASATSGNCKSHRSLNKSDKRSTKLRSSHSVSNYSSSASQGSRNHRHSNNKLFNFMPESRDTDSVDFDSISATSAASMAKRQSRKMSSSSSNSSNKKLSESQSDNPGPVFQNFMENKMIYERMRASR